MVYWIEMIWHNANNALGGYGNTEAEKLFWRCHSLKMLEKLLSDQNIITSEDA